MFSRLRNFFKKSKNENEGTNKNKEGKSSDLIEESRISGSPSPLLRNGTVGNSNEYISNVVDGSNNRENTVSVFRISFNESEEETNPRNATTTTTTTARKISHIPNAIKSIGSSKSLNLKSVSSVAADDSTLEMTTTKLSRPTSLEERIACDANNIVEEDATPTPTLTTTTTAATATATATTIVAVNPTGNNNIACEAISQKLNDISAVVGSLDAAIRDVQTDADILESNSSTSSSDKKRRENDDEEEEKAFGPSPSSSGEDWHSRSTEEDSFATASEENFLPHSHSSSFQTASTGHTPTSILLGGGSPAAKNSNETSEADDSTLSAFDIPELIMSPNNTSFDSSDRSYFSAKQDQTSTSSSRDAADINRNINQNRPTTEITAEINNDDDENSVDDVEDLHSQSVTPTPDADADADEDVHLELESFIADAPSSEILTEEAPMPLTSVTPEVSTCSSTNNFNKMQFQQQQQQQQGRHHAQLPLQPLPQFQPQLQQSDTNNANKTNVAWRRSKYYENITKQTIRGFL